MLRNRMLTAEEEKLSEEVDTTEEDVQRISQFAKLNSRTEEISDQLKALRDEKEKCDDALMELELTDEDELVPYQRLTTFFHLPASEVVSILQIQQTDLEERIQKLEEESDTTTAEINQVKSVLKSKFKDTINLER